MCPNNYNPEKKVVFTTSLLYVASLYMNIENLGSLEAYLYTLCMLFRYSDCHMRGNMLVKYL